MPILDSSPRILVVRALQLGDLLCAVPALRSLRQWQPTANITLCSLPWAKEFAQRFSHLIDDFIEFPGYPGLPEVAFDSNRWRAWQSEVHGRYDLVIQLHGSGTFINDFVRSLGARDTAGFHPVSQPELALKHSYAWPECGHEIERLKQAVLQLGAEDTGNKLELPVTANEIAEAKELLHSHGHRPNADTICMHTGGRSLTRRWPIDQYKVVAEALLDQGHSIVLTGMESERDLADELQKLVGGRCIDLVGRTNLGQLIGLIDQADLLISNDTGVSHIAAARQTPSVVIGLGSDLHRWLPLNRKLHKPVYVDVACRPCYAPGCPTNFECAQGVTPEMVLAAVNEQLANPKLPMLTSTAG